MPTFFLLFTIKNENVNTSLHFNIFKELKGVVFVRESF
jgi:hypothetical protein